MSGWRYAVQPDTGPFQPFRRAVDDSGETGMVALGLDLPASALGSTVSVSLTSTPRRPCGAADPVDAPWWEWWTA